MRSAALLRKGSYRQSSAQALGSVRAVVDPDASGSETDKVVEARDYYPFGLKMPGRVLATNEET